MSQHRVNAQKTANKLNFAPLSVQKIACNVQHDATLHRVAALRNPIRLQRNGNTPPLGGVAVLHRSGPALVALEKPIRKFLHGPLAESQAAKIRTVRDRARETADRAQSRANVSP